MEYPVLFMEQVRDAFVTSYSVTDVPREELEKMFNQWLDYLTALSWRDGAIAGFKASNDCGVNGETITDINEIIAQLPENPFKPDDETDDFDAGKVSDGYHTFDELYRYRMLYNAAFLNEYASHQDVKIMSDGNTSIGVRNVGKSKFHHDGTKPFGGGWFIVWFVTDDGHVISNHYEDKYWDLFNVPEYSAAPEWKGTTPNQEADSMEQWIKDKNNDNGRCEKCGSVPELVRVNVLGKPKNMYMYECGNCGWESELKERI